MMRHRYLPLALIASLGFVLLASLPSPAEEAASKEQIDKLIKQMGSSTFAERQKATQALDAIGGPALETLKKAAQSGDAEVRSRAGDLVKKIETRLTREKLLSGKCIHLVCKDMLVKDAVADFQKKSGYLFYLHDPDHKLKDRTITLDTGTTTFWHAFGLFCAKAGLVEATVDDLVKSRRGSRVPPPSYGDPVRKPVPIKKPDDAPDAPPAKKQVQPDQPTGGPMIRIGDIVIHQATRGLILLKDGKPQKLPTDDSGAVRVRDLAAPSGLNTADGIDAPKVKEVSLTLEVTPEPRLQLRSIQSVRVEKALDANGQTLKPGRPMGPFDPTMWEMPIGGQRVHVCLKKGPKASKSLKELKGVLSAQVLAEPVLLLTADNLAEAAGKTFKGQEGGWIKVLEVKTDDKHKTTIQFEFERPPNIFPTQAQVQMQDGSGGFAVRDDKGNVLPIRISRQVSTLTLHCQPHKGQGSPAKLLFLGRKSVAIDIPFNLKGKVSLQPINEV